MKKTCKRKHWQLINPIAHAIEGARITPDEQLNDLSLRELSSLDALTTGRGGVQEWSDMTALMNLCETMAASGVGPEALPSCKTAQTALQEAALRYELTGRMGLSASGITSLRDVLEYHQLQRKSICRSEYERLIQRTVNRIKSKAPDVVEV